jgi:hypothetical protein
MMTSVFSLPIQMMRDWLVGVVRGVHRQCWEDREESQGVSQMSEAN